MRGQAAHCIDAMIAQKAVDGGPGTVDGGPGTVNGALTLGFVTGRMLWVGRRRLVWRWEVGWRVCRACRRISLGLRLFWLFPLFNKKISSLLKQCFLLR